MHALLLYKKVNFRAVVSRWPSQTAETQTKVTWLTGWVTAPMVQTMTWPQMNVLAVSVSHLYKCPKLSLCKHYPPRKEKGTWNTGFALKDFSFLFAPQNSYGVVLPAIDILKRVLVHKASGPLEFSAKRIIHTHCYYLFVFHQEKLLQRNSEFHATLDNRGITQRAKRSPGKQPETGMLFGIIIIY